MPDVEPGVTGIVRTALRSDPSVAFQLCALGSARPEASCSSPGTHGGIIGICTFVDSVVSVGASADAPSDRTLKVRTLLGVIGSATVGWPNPKSSVDPAQQQRSNAKDRCNIPVHAPRRSGHPSQIALRRTRSYACRRDCAIPDLVIAGPEEPYGMGSRGRKIICAILPKWERPRLGR